MPVFVIKTSYKTNFTIFAELFVLSEVLLCFKNLKKNKYNTINLKE